MTIAVVSINFVSEASASCEVVKELLDRIGKLSAEHPRITKIAMVSTATAGTIFLGSAGAIYFSTEGITAVTPGYEYASDKEKEKLLHVVFIGDSLSKNFYLGSSIDTAWRVRTENQRDLIIDVDSASKSVRSLFERISETTPVMMTEYSKPGAKVSAPNGRNFAQWVLKIDHFEDQVSSVLSETRFPELTLIWIGHNEVDWIQRMKDLGESDKDRVFMEIRKEFKREYERNLLRLVDRAERETHPSAIVVFGLINFDSFFNARRKCEEAKSKNSELYPYLLACYEQFESMKPEYRDGMIALATALNSDMQDIVNRVASKIKNPAIKLTYQDNLSQADISDPIAINAMDAWHPSIVGHSQLSSIIFDAIKPHLKFIEERRE